MSTTRENVNFEWIASWDWTKTAKKIYRAYRKKCSRVISNLGAMKSTSHLVSDKGGIVDALL